jgi:hypothetical protein
MISPDRTRRLPTAILWSTLLLSLSVQAQQTPAPETKPDSSTSAKTSLTPEEQRKKDLEADTERLYKLTQELKAEVAKTDKNTLSVTVVKKAQEIERLAKSIRERSRTPR